MIMAAIDTRPIKGSLIDDPEALDLFSGPDGRVDSYVSMLEANGVTKAEPVDNDPVTGGGEAHSILTNSFYLGLQKKADQGVIGYVHLAPACKFTCPARIIDRNLGKEDKRSPVMSERGFEDGVLGLSHGHLSLLRQDTNANIRAAAIAISVGRNGGIVSFETQRTATMHLDRTFSGRVQRVTTFLRSSDACPETLKSCATSVVRS